MDIVCFYDNMSRRITTGKNKSIIQGLQFILRSVCVVLAKKFVEHHMHIRFTQNPVAVGVEHVKGEYICVKKVYVCTVSEKLWDGLYGQTQTMHLEAIYS